MLMFNKRRGVSLVEVTIVLAISALLIIIATSTFSTRSGVAVDDAAKQTESIYQKARNEAIQGLGSTNSATFNSGDELFGQAVQFRNNCAGSGTPSCITVFKLRVNTAGNPAVDTVSSYESYDVALREGLEFAYLIPNCSFATCYQAPGGGMQLISNPPIGMSTGQVPMIVTKNGNGGSYLFASVSGSFGVPTNVTINNSTNYSTSRQGILQLALFRRDGAGDTFQTARHRYFMNINVSTGAVTIVKP